MSLDITVYTRQLSDDLIPKIQKRLNDFEMTCDSSKVFVQLPPNSLTTMQLRTDDIKGLLFRPGYSLGHKLKSYYTKRGLAKNIKTLTRNVEIDLNGIDNFIRRWYELHQPLTTNWTGP